MPGDGAGQAEHPRPVAEVEQAVQVVLRGVALGPRQFVATDVERGQFAEGGGLDFDQAVAAVLLERVHVVAQTVAPQEAATWSMRSLSAFLPAACRRRVSSSSTNNSPARPSERLRASHRWQVIAAGSGEARGVVGGCFPDLGRARRWHPHGIAVGHGDVGGRAQHGGLRSLLQRRVAFQLRFDHVRQKRLGSCRAACNRRCRGTPKPASPR